MRKLIASALAGGMALMGVVALGSAAQAEEPLMCVPLEPVYEEQENPDYIPAVPDSYTNETTDWLTTPPDGEGWQVIDERTIEVEPGVEEVVKYQYKRWVETTYKTVDNPDYVPEQVIEHPAVGEPTIEVIDTPAWTEKIHHDAVYEDRVTKVEYKKWKVFWWDYKWFPVNAQPDANSGWKKTGNTKTERVKIKDAWVEKIEHPATYKTVPNPDYKPAWTEVIPAQGEPTIEVVDVEGHWDWQWFDTEQGEPWIFVKKKVKVEGKDPVTRTEYKYFREVLVPGTPAVGEPTIEVLVQEGRECPTMPEPRTDSETLTELDCEARTVTHTETNFVWEPIWDQENWEYYFSEEPTSATSSQVTADATEQECPTPPAEEPPAEEEPPAPPAEPETPAKPEAKPAAAPVTPEAKRAGDELAMTGPAEVMGLTGAAALALIAGTGLVALRRRFQ